MEAGIHKGWRSRGYIPHFDAPDTLQTINFHLGDALPAVLLADYRKAKTLKQKKLQLEIYKKIEKHLDAGHGNCWLNLPAVAEKVENSILHFDEERYRMIAWVIMPNHIHILLETIEGFPLEKVMHSIKSYTASKANKILRRKGTFWQEEYFDRFIRDERHYHNAVWYIHQNPVTAGLVEKAEDWPYSSARFK